MNQAFRIFAPTGYKNLQNNLANPSYLWYHWHIILKGFLCMDLKALTKNIFKNACVIFTVFTALYSVISAIINVDDSVVRLEVSRIILFFMASVLFSAANGIFKIERLHGALKILLHYLLTLAAFWACMLLPLSLDPSTTIVGIVIFSLIYLIVALIAYFIRSRYRANTEKDEEYVPQYKKK